MEHYKVIEARIERLATTFDTQHREQLESLAPDAKNALESRLAGFNDILCIAVVFHLGFAQIAALGPLALAVSAEVLQWVSIRDRAFSARGIAGMLATNLCTIIEDYLKTRASERADHVNSTAEAQKLVKPSARRDGSVWLGGLANVFHVALSEDEQISLLEMITFRNEYVHDPAAASQRNVSGEAIKCWVLASRLLCQRVALSR